MPLRKIRHCRAYNGVVITKTYYKAPTELLYSISATVAGLLAGPLILIPLALLVGRTFSIFWSLLGALVTMMNPNDYILFVLSRLFTSIFGMEDLLV